MAFDAEVALSPRCHVLKVALMKVDLFDLPILDCLVVLCWAHCDLGTSAWGPDPRHPSRRPHPGPQDWVGYWGRSWVPLPEVGLDVRNGRTQTSCLRRSRLRVLRVGKVRRKLVMKQEKVVWAEVEDENLFFVLGRGRMVAAEVACRA